MSEPVFSDVPIVLFNEELNFNNGILTINHYFSGSNFIVVNISSETITYGRYLKLQLITQVLFTDWEDLEIFTITIRAEDTNIKKLIPINHAYSLYLRRYLKIQTNDFLNVKIYAFP